MKEKKKKKIGSVPCALPINLTRLPFHRLNCIPGKQIPGCQSTEERENYCSWFLAGSLGMGTGTEGQLRVPPLTAFVPETIW